MAYTPLIKFDIETKERLVSYLTMEIDNHETERSEWVRSIEKYEKLYWADPSKNAEDKSMPLSQGANIIVPLIAIAVEMLQAKTIQKLFGLEQFISVKLPDIWDDIDSDLEKILDHELLVVASAKEAIENCSLEFHKFGTCVFKTGYYELERKAIQYDGEEEKEVLITVHKGATIEHVQLVNFLMPFSSSSPMGADWCGEFHTSTPFELLNLTNSGLFYKESYEHLQTFFSDLNTAGNSQSLGYLREKESQENKTPIWPKRVHWYEVWLNFDVDGDGEKEDVVVYYHRDSQHICGARYNDRHDLSRPYFVKANFPVEGRWAGIGQCQMGEQFQIEITTQHRQRIDAATIAILRMFKAKKGSSINPDEPIFAGKIWMVDEMDDLDIFQSGEVYPSAYQNEQSAIMFWQQRSTVNELTLGMPQVGTPGTAASEMARVSEGNLRFDYTYSRFKDVIKDVSLDTICIIGKYGVQHEVLFEQYATGKRVKEFLSQPSILIKQEIIIKFSLAGQSQNKLLDRASWTQLGGMYTQYMTNMLQVAGQLGDQALTQTIAKKALVGATEIMRQVFQSFDVRNVDKIVLTTKELNGGPEINSETALPGIAGILPSPGLGFVNPVNTTPGGG